MLVADRIAFSVDVSVIADVPRIVVARPESQSRALARIDV